MNTRQTDVSTCGHPHPHPFWGNSPNTMRSTHSWIVAALVMKITPPSSFLTPWRWNEAMDSRLASICPINYKYQELRSREGGSEGVGKQTELVGEDSTIGMEGEFVPVR